MPRNSGSQNINPNINNTYNSSKNNVVSRRPSNTIQRSSQSKNSHSR